MKRLFLLGLFAAMCACTSSGGGGGSNLSSIAVTPATASAFVSGTQQFTATGTYSDGTTDDITTQVDWISSQTSIASISSTGLATGVAVGASTITATLDGKSGNAALTVGTAPSGKIAFVSLRDNDVNQVYVMNADGSGQVRLSTHDGFDPLWSPDASKVLFSSYKDVSLELYTANPDGTGETQLTFPTWGADWSAMAAWSPDGTQIAFISYHSSHTQVYTMTSAGGGEAIVSNVMGPAGLLTFTYPSWSPSGGTITADTHWWTSGPPVDAGGIYAFPPNTGIQLTHNADDHNAVWSPDGTRIAFYRLNSGTNPTGTDIYVMNSGGGGETKLAEGLNPVWSPDGSKIAFLRDLNGNGFMLYVMNADGSNEVNLMSDLDNLGVTWMPSWSPDGTMLTFSWGSNIYITNADGTGRIKVTSDNKSAVGPQWAP